jgi:hypothetical protein
VVLARSGREVATVGSGAVAVASVKRPPRETLYDVGVGVEPEKGPTDQERDAELLNEDGKLPESAYTDLEQLD